jgi:crotonobetainyl-CoA:carnitine CoA-transferase CaiB-like acyl-CoA transferase
MSKEEHFGALCRALGREDLTSDPRFADFIARADNLATLAPLIQEPLLARTTAQWIETLEQHDVLCNRVYAISDWLSDAHVLATGAFKQTPIEGMGEVPIAVIPGADALLGSPSDAGSPGLGQHSRAVLRSFGWSDHEIERMAASGAAPLAD